MTPDAHEKKKVIRRIQRSLRKQYGEPPEKEAADPLDVLVRTILSQNTTDANSSRAFERLRERFGAWDAARRAPCRQIEEAIRVGGLAKVKARRIKKILSQIHESYGEMSLDSLRDMEPGEASAALSAFEGVGPKTVNCVLLFGCAMNVFPVDTHILRIPRRLGLIPQNTLAIPPALIAARALAAKPTARLPRKSLRTMIHDRTGMIAIVAERASSDVCMNQSPHR